MMRETIRTEDLTDLNDSEEEDKTDSKKDLKHS